MPAETIQWVAPDGTTLPFDGTSGYEITDGTGGGPDGRFAPTFRHVTEQLPNDGGTRLRNVVLQPRTLTIPLEIKGNTALDTRALWRALVAAMDPRKGDGRLRFTPPDGEPREFRCRYMQGLEGVDSLAKSDPALKSWLVAPQFVAYDAMAQSISDTTASWSIADGGGEFFPLFPLVLGDSVVFAQSTIVVLGDDLAWPVFNLLGPFDGFTLKNNTMGRTISGTTSCGAGESLIIDTRPGTMSDDPKSVRDHTGTNRFTELTSWDLWPLTPGYQEIRIELDGATTDSNVSARWRERWETT